ncbi:MAG: efflux RND transporter permease subunit, partial [Planctomycetes bacterium]|nr:efflux RND transporter permease subunit [Planctomycetota bacterium]
MIRFFVHHPTAANLLMIVFLAAGALSLRGLRRETLPSHNPPEVEIRVPYPGATAEEVEEAVCQRVEDALEGVRFVAELRSEARENLGVVTVDMEEAGEIITFKDEIETRLAAIDDFPDEVEEPILRELHATERILALLVSGPMTAVDLKAYCEDLKERLRRLPEISLVKIRGFSEHQLQIELDEPALRRHGLSAAQVAEMVRRQNIDLPAGAIETRDSEVLVRFVERRVTPQELQDLVIVGGPAGAQVRLGEIARVTDAFANDEDQVLLGDRRAGLLMIEKNRNQDTLRVAAAVKQFVEEERGRRPQVQIEVTQDMSVLVAGRLQMLASNGVQGMVLVFLAMWLFFNARLSFWVVMSLPVSFLGAFFFVPHLGLTISMTTSVALLLALGLLMDDGIVIAENIAAHVARGKRPLQAALDGVS